MDQAELDQIVSSVRERLSGRPTDAFCLAQAAGLWLRPRARTTTNVIGRVLTFDKHGPPLVVQRDVGRCAARSLVAAAGFHVDALTDGDLDAIADALQYPQTSQSSTQLRAC